MATGGAPPEIGPNHCFAATPGSERYNFRRSCFSHHLPATPMQQVNSTTCVLWCSRTESNKLGALRAADYTVAQRNGTDAELHMMASPRNKAYLCRNVLRLQLITLTSSVRTSCRPLGDSSASCSCAKRQWRSHLCCETVQTSRGSQSVKFCESLLSEMVTSRVTSSPWILTPSFHSDFCNLVIAWTVSASAWHALCGR